jgi:hypothetical protein
MERIINQDAFRKQTNENDTTRQIQMKKRHKI